MEEKVTIKYSKSKYKYRIGFIIASLVVALGAITMIFPYLWMFLTSFKSTNEAYGLPMTLLPSAIVFFALIAAIVGGSPA